MLCKTITLTKNEEKLMVLASAISDLLLRLFEFTPGVAVGFNT
jgi:hypothetical protein